jgi:hypothetical protein
MRGASGMVLNEKERDSMASKVKVRWKVTIEVIFER